jgi:2,3-bisphosphoglycerate-dependent phosphoglycerate mutase
MLSAGKEACNSLRGLGMVLDRLSPQEIVKRKLRTGVPMMYRLNADSTVAKRMDLARVRH